jgi:hypothetical protein
MTTNLQPAGHGKEPWWLAIQHPGNVSLPVNVVERGRWYHQQMRSARMKSHAVDICILVLTAGVPFAVAANAPGWVPALLGALAAVGAGLRQVFSWQKDWTSFTVASGQIEAEIVRFGYGIGDYQEAATAAGRLAERVEDITAAETGTWVQRVNEAHRDGNNNLPSSAECLFACQALGWHPEILPSLTAERGCTQASSWRYPLVSYLEWQGFTSADAGGAYRQAGVICGCRQCPG